MKRNPANGRVLSSAVAVEPVRMLTDAYGDREVL